MNHASRFALIIGILLLVEGVWGMFSPVVFGVLSTNHVHATIHIVLGIAGIVTARRGMARGFLIFLGILLLAVGLLWFVPPAGDIITDLLAVNRAVAIVNIVVGVLSLIFASGNAPVPAKRR